MKVDFHVDLATRHLMGSLRNSRPRECQDEYLNEANISSMVRGYVSQNAGRGYLYTEIDGRPVAGLLYELKEEPLRRSLYIKYYFCEQSYRRQGFTTGLVKRAIDLAKHAGENNVTACVQDCNSPSISLLEKLGFYVVQCNYVKILRSKTEEEPKKWSTKKVSDNVVARVSRSLDKYVSKISKNVDMAKHAVRIYGEMIRKSVHGQDNYVFYYNDDQPDFHSFALCEVVSCSFRNCLQVHYLSSDNNKYVLALSELDAIASSRNIPELDITLDNNDEVTQEVLLENGFELCDRTYLLSGATMLGAVI